VSATVVEYSKLFGEIATDVATMARCACVACNSCTCACSCRYAPESDTGEIIW